MFHFKDKQPKNNIQDPLTGMEIEFTDNDWSEKEKNKMNNKKSFLDRFLIIFALVSIVGVSGFYIIGVQPVLLKDYATNAINQSNKVDQDFTDQKTVIGSTYTDLFQSSFYNLATSCSLDQQYTKKDTDYQKIELQAVSSLPKEEFKKITASSVFYEPKIEQLYSDYYTSYKELLSKDNANINNLRPIVNYLNYRNSWIQACVKINSSTGITSEIQGICKDLKASYDAFNTDTNKADLWKQVGPAIQKNLTKCSDIDKIKNKNIADFNRWKLDWLNNYDSIMIVTPVFDSQLKDLQTSIDTFKSQTVALQNNIDTIVKEKQNSTSLFYLLKIRF